MTISEAINQALLDTMKSNGVSKAEMSRRLQVSRAAVTEALGDRWRNWSLHTLQEWTEAAGGTLHIRIRSSEKGGTTDES